MSLCSSLTTRLFVPDNEMEMVGHEAKSEHLGKVKPTQIANQVEKIVPLPIPDRQSIKSCPGNDMVYRGNIGANEPGDAWHEDLLISILELTIW
jgi:hypothetical protein